MALDLSFPAGGSKTGRSLSGDGGDEEEWMVAPKTGYSKKAITSRLQSANGARIFSTPPPCQTPAHVRAVRSYMRVTSLIHFPFNLMVNIFGYLNMPEKRKACRTCSSFYEQLNSPVSYSVVSIPIDKPLPCPFSSWMSMIKNGVFQYVQKLRVFKEEDTVDVENRTANMVLLTALSVVMKKLKILTIELGRQFVGDGDVVYDVFNTILDSNCESLEMLLLHTDVHSRPWKFSANPLIMYPKMAHLNFSGDFDPKDSIIYRCPSLKHCKMSCAPGPMEEAVKAISTNCPQLLELTIRPLHRGPVNELQDLSPTFEIRDLINLEWNGEHSGPMCEDQLLQMMTFPAKSRIRNKYNPGYRDKSMYKISSDSFTDKVCDKMRDLTNIRGLFIGKNSLSTDSFMKLIDSVENLRWLRLSKDFGPKISEKQEMMIREKFKGLNFWMRDFKDKEKRMDFVAIWSMNPGICS